MADVTATKSIYDMACEILQATNDGDDLAPEHLYLLECTVNGLINEAGEIAFYELHKNAVPGPYKRPWYHGIEHLTKDHEGYIYWKGQQVEHYSFTDYDKAHTAALELAERCKHLEKIGIEVNTTNAVWIWEEYEERKQKNGM